MDVLEPNHYELLADSRRGTRFRQALGAWRAIVKRLDETRYDLVDFCGGEFGLVTWWLSRRSERPMLVAHTDGLELLASEREREYAPAVTLRDHLRRGFGAQTHERLSHAAFAYADVFLTLCQVDRDYVVGRNLFDADHAEVIPPGLDVEYLERPFVAEKEHRVAYMGSWIPRKGVASVTTIMSNLLATRGSLHLDIFGAHNDREVILNSFPGLVRPRVTIHPKLPAQTLAAELSRASVFLFPTQYEGFGMAISEAMACSCAVVTTPTGYGAELTNDRDALICGFEDVADMERAVSRLLDDEPARRRLASEGWNRVRSLRWEANVAKLEATYTRWLGEFGRGLLPRVRETRAAAAASSNR